MADKIDINITTKDGSKGQAKGAGALNVSGLKNLDKTLSKAIDTSLGDLSKDLGKILKQELSKLSNTKTGSISKNKPTKSPDVTEAVKTLRKELVGEIKKLIIATSKKSEPGSRRPQFSTKKLEDVIHAKLSEISRKLSDKSGAKLEIDNTTLSRISKAIAGKAAGTVDKDLVSKLRNLSSEVHELKKAVTDIKVASKDIAKSFNDATKKLLNVPKVTSAGTSTSKSTIGIDSGKELLSNVKKAKFILASLPGNISINLTEIDNIKSGVKEIKQAIKDLGKSSKTILSKQTVKVVYETDTKQLDDVQKQIDSPKTQKVVLDLEGRSLLDIYKDIESIEKKIKLDSTLNIDVKALKDLKDIINKIHDAFAKGKATLSSYARSGEKSRDPNVGRRVDLAKNLIKKLEDAIDRSTIGRGKRKVEDTSVDISKSIDVSSLQKLLDNTFKSIVVKGGARRAFEEAAKGLEEFKKLSSDLDVKSLEKASFEIKEVTKSVKGMSDTFKDVTKSAQQSTTTLKKILTSSQGASQISATRSAATSTIRSYTPGVIKPEHYRNPGIQKAVIGQDISQDEKRVYNNISSISKSLEKLQKNIYNTVSAGLQTSQKAQRGWEIAIKDRSKPSSAFKLRGRQFGMDIVNTKKLRGLTGTQKGGATELLNTYRKQLSKDLFETKIKPEKMSADIADWIKKSGIGKLGDDIKESLGKSLSDSLQSLKDVSINLDTSELQTLVTSTLKDGLIDVFSATAGSSDIRKALSEQGLLKTISIPAAKVSSSGTLVTETRHGRQRAVTQSQSYKTGQEVLFEKYFSILEKSGKEKSPGVQKLAAGVRAVGPYAKSEEIVYSDKDVQRTAGDISATLLKGVSGTIDDIVKLYKEAAPSIGIGRQQFTSGTDSPIQASKELVKILYQINTAAEGSKGNLDLFVTTMNNVGVSAFEVAKSKDVVKFENIYDDISKIIGKHLDELSKHPATAQKAFRGIEKSISQLEGLSPIVERGMPRRGAQQSDVIRARFQASKAFTGPSFIENVENETDKFDISVEAQKTFIKDVNKRMRDLYYEIDQLGKLKGEFPEEVASRLKELQTGSITSISSLGIPESQAGGIKRFSKEKALNLTDAENILEEGMSQLTEGLKGIEIMMSSGNLRRISPFGSQFQQTGRNISNVSAAREFRPEDASGIAGLPSQFPTLKSQSEQELIKSGRYGQGGYGFNVITELKHTAGTFEDQILISGKLADAVTTATKKLVRPFGSKEGVVTDIKSDQYLRDTTKLIQEVNREIMTKLGAPEKYKGRADVALIKDVQREMTSVRDETIEVQTAKIAEVFLNSFGRKFTTRFGSKGVAVTPSGPSNELINILKEHTDKSIKVLTSEERKSAGLGVALMPKSIGEMAAELIEEKAPDLAPKLVESGNKFLLDMFKDAKEGLVTKEEATKNSKVFNEASEALKSIGIDISDSVDSISAIKEAYRKTGKAEFKAEPIDIRISSLGAAKRGLQTETLEIIASNLAGTGAGGETVIKDTVDYEKLLGAKGKVGEFSKASKRLGFTGALKTGELGTNREEATKALQERLQSEYGYSEDLAKRAAELESVSSFYVDVIDEFGKRGKSLVGKKFVQIIEEPGQFEEWTKGQIAGGEKGAKLNVPAYAAYTTIFGKGSEFIKEINSSLDSKQAEGYEQIRAYMAERSTPFRESILKELKETPLSDIGSFVGQVGSFTEGAKDSLLGTILDTDKYKTSFKTTLPSTKRKEEDKKTKKITEKGFEQRSLYVPGSITRGTFEDPLESGKFGLDKVTRRLQGVINAARSLQAWQDKNVELMTEFDKETTSRFAGSTITTKLVSPQDVSFEKMLGVSEQFLSPQKGTLDSKIFETQPGDFLKKHAKTLRNRFIKYYEQFGNYDSALNASQQEFAGFLSQVSGFNKTKKSLLKATLIGDPEGEILKTSFKGMSLDNQITALQELTKVVGSSIFDRPEDLLKRQQELDTALESYHKSLASTLVGKKGAIAKTYFTRKIPAVLAKATNATVDRTEELSSFSSSLLDISKQFKDIEGIDALEGYAKDVKSVELKHKESVTGYKKAGITVLKQNELGVPETLAKTLSVEYKKYGSKETTKGTLASLLKYKDVLTKDYKGKPEESNIMKYIEDELVPYVESIRFPFTGTSSIQPFQAKLLKGKKGMSEKTIMVPGVPEMDMQAFEKVYEGVRGTVSNLSEKRESLMSKATPESEESAKRLTSVIDQLNAAISAVIPKYVSHSQKLDFDGDQIEIHSAMTKNARQEIKKHFDILTTDVDSTSAKFRDVFTYGAQQPSQGDFPLAFGMKSFEKKFGPEKGFDYLRKPFTSKDLEFMNPKEKLSVLATKKSETEGLSSAESVNTIMSKAFESAGEKFTSVGGDGELKDIINKAINQVNSLVGADAENTKALINGALKTELLNSRLDDAVEAQLFKIHTGPETESITRIMRAYESGKGFGGGEISLFDSTKKPKLDKSFMLRERNTQMNELMRFAIQKGMDVKHAGEKTVASEMVRELTSGEGAVKSLISKVESGKGGYEELGTFMETNTEALKNQFGRYTTKELQGLSEGLDIEDVSGMSREKLVGSLVKSLGFEGFLLDMQKELHKQAVKGISSQEKLDVEGADKYLKKLYSEGKSIPVSKTITAPNDPLYRLRTPSAAQIPDIDEFTKELELAMSSVGKDIRSGAYSELTRSFNTNIVNITKSIDENLFKKFDTSIGSLKFEDPSRKTKVSDISRNLEKYESAIGLGPTPKRVETDILNRLAENTTPEAAILEGLSISSSIKPTMTDEEVDAVQESHREFLEAQALLNARVKRLADVYRDVGSAIKKTPITSVKDDKEIVSQYNRGIKKPQVDLKTSAAVPGIPTISSTSSVQPPTGLLKTGGPVSVFLEGINSNIVFPSSVISSTIKSIAPTILQSSGQQTKYDEDDLTNLLSRGNYTPEEFSQDKEVLRKTRSSDPGKTRRDKGLGDTPQFIEPYAGEGVTSELKNIGLLRTKSKQFLESVENIDFNEDILGLPKELQGLIKEAETVGTRKQTEFISAIERAKDLGEQGAAGGIGYKQVTESWRLYKDKVTQYLYNNAKKAEDAVKAAEESGDFNEVTLAYENFQNKVERLQDRIKSDVGKASDVYSRNKMWLYPELAKAAGVFLTQGEIQQKSAGELEDDPELRRLFEKVTSDLGGKGGGSPRSAISKARDVIKEITHMDDGLVNLMDNAKLVKRLGTDITEAWDFEASVTKITRLRAALELFKKYNVSDMGLSVETRNLESVISLLKDIETRVTSLDIGSAVKAGGTGIWGETGAIPVPKWLDPETQKALHTRNISKIQEYLKRPQEEKGAKVGEDIVYNEKIVDQAGIIIKNQRHLFTKYTESVNSAGESIGKFSQRHVDLNEAMTKGRGFTTAIKRAAAWGAASSIVYGGVGQLKSAVNTLAEIETNMASLRMVMSQLDTDFGGMTKSAVGFAKNYGVPVTDVLKSMKVFAQQGLSQEEILDRTKVSTLASNVTTLSSVDSTEALTAAMKVFTKEGDTALRFLDSWSEVESKHAITAANMADAIKKSAAAAKTAGLTFDQLNGIVAAVGSVTRQTGKEVGTSMRFILRRLTSDKGPKELGKMNISTMTGAGELRSGFDILGDLASKWDDLNGAQKLSIAQAIGGTRQYNSLIVMMDNWGEAVDAVEDSINSKGSAERKNLELMKTYAKQVEQTKASFVELQMSVGKVVFPVFKTALSGMKGLMEIITNIPDPIKAAAAGALLLVTYLSKGAQITELISDFFRGGTLLSGGLLSSLKDELQVGAFEAFGLGQAPTRGSKTEGLKTVTSGIREGAVLGKSMEDFESLTGKAMHILVSSGRSFNSYMVSASQAAGKTGELIGKGVQLTGEGIGSLSAMLGAKIPYASIVGEVAAMGTTAGGEFIERMSSKLGSAGGAMFRSWAKDNSGIIASIAPMLLTIDMLAPHISKAGTAFMKTTRSSQDFEKSMYHVRRQNEDTLSSIRGMSKSYGKLGSDISKINKMADPTQKDRRQELGTYKSPLLLTANLQKNAVKFTNELATSNLGLIAGYDKLGNAVLKSNSNFKTLLSTLEKSKLKEMAQTEIAVAAKHIEDLTKTGGSEKWKNELKSLTKEIPVFGKLISDQIKTSPAKAMEITISKMNKLVSAKSKSPLSTVYDEDIVNLQKALVKLKAQFNSTYKDFKRVISGISVEGLSREDITKILGSEELRKGYELMLEVEPRLQIAGVKGVAKWKDVLGAEVMKKIFPKEGASIDVTKALTTANIETAGISRRQGKVVSGDLVTFMDDATEEFGMAGNQAIVKLKETTDGVFEWVATYFNTKTMKIEERAFGKDMQNMVEAIFPQRAIEKDLSDRIDALNTFIAGAGAGLRGITSKDFKRDFSLGERFFSDVSTSTIIQGTQGFTPKDGFGESPFQKDWAEDFKKYYAKPVEEYSRLLDRLQKMKLSGIDPKNIKITTGLYESIVKLQNVLKNNQVVMQYRAVFADLTKTMEANTRATEESVAVEKSRLNLTKETSGLLRGKTSGLAQVDLGVRKRRDLSAQQRLLIESPDFEKSSKRLSELETRRKGTSEGIYAADKALVSIASIRDVSKGFGTSLSPEDMKKYTETVARTGDMGAAELKIETSRVVDNTAATVERLDRILENFQDGDSLDKLINKLTSFSITDAPIKTLEKIMTSDSDRISNALDQLAERRKDAVSSGDNETIIKVNKALDILSKGLIEKVGLKRASKVVAGGDFGKDELIQRAFGGIDFKTLQSEMGKYIPEGKKSDKFGESVSEIYDIQSKNVEKSAEKTLLNSKNIAGVTAAVATYEAFNTNYLNDKIKDLDAKISNLESQITVGGGETDVSTNNKDVTERIVELKELRSEEEKRAKFHGTVKAASGGATGAMVFARSMGLTEKNVKRLGAGGAGLGIYGAAKMQTGLTGDDLPDYFKDYGKEVSKFAKIITTGGDISKWTATKEFKNKSEEFVRKFTEQTLGLVKDTEALNKHADAVNKDTDGTENKNGKDTKEGGGKFNGGYVQKFSKGGTVKQIMPGAGDKQPSLLTPGEQVLTVEQIKDLLNKKELMSTLKDMLKSGPVKLETPKDIYDKILSAGQVNAAGIMPSRNEDKLPYVLDEKPGSPIFDALKKKFPNLDKILSAGQVNAAGIMPSNTYDTGILKGPGTGTSDSMVFGVPPMGSYIIPSKYSNKVKDYVKEFIKSSGIINNPKKPTLGGPSKIRVSNGELFINPRDAKILGKDRLETLRTGKIPKFANGGAIGAVSSGASTDGDKSVSVAIDEASLNKLAQISASVTAATLIRYATEKSTQKVRLSELDKLAREETDAITDLIMSNEDAAKKVLDTMNKQEEKIKNTEKAPTEEVSLVLDPEKEFKKTTDDINKLKETLTGTFDDATKDVEKLKEDMARMTIAEEFKMEIEAMENAVKNAKLKDSLLKGTKSGRGMFAGKDSPLPIDFGKRGTSELDTNELMSLIFQREKDFLSILTTVFRSLKDTIIKSTPAEKLGFQTSDKLGRYQELETERQVIFSSMETIIAKLSEVNIEADAGTPGAAEEVEKWNDVLEDNKDKLSDITDIQNKYLDSLSTYFLETELLQKSLRMVTDVISELSVAAFKAQYDISNLGFGGKLKGSVTGLQLPQTSIEGLSSEQYAWTQASNTMKNNLKNYKSTTTIYNKMMEEISQLKTIKSQLETNLATTDYGDTLFTKGSQRKSIETSLEIVNSRISEFEDRLSGMGKTLEQAGKQIYIFYQLTDIIHNIENSIRNIKAVDLSESLGLYKVEDAINKLYGGSSPFAPQRISPTTRDEAAQYGVSLVSGKSDEFEIKRFQLLKQIVTSSGQQRDVATRELYNLPRAQAEEVDNTERLRKAERTKRSAQTIVDAATVISDIAVKGDFTKEEKSKLEDVAKAGYVSAEEIISSGRPDLVEDILKSLKDSITNIIPDGQSFEELIQASEASNNPIVSRLDTSNEYLRAIAEDMLGSDAFEKLNEKLKVKAGPSTSQKVIPAMLSPLNTLAAVFKGEKTGPSFFQKMMTATLTPLYTLIDIFKEGRRQKPTPPKEKPSLVFGGKIKGPGTGTSDSIGMMATPGSYVVQSKYADKAQNYLGNFASGGKVPIRVSNGEYIMSPEQVAIIGGKNQADLLNRGKLTGYAGGGFLSNSSEYLTDLTKDLKGFRLETLREETSGFKDFLYKNLVGAGAATMQVGTKVGKGFVDIASLGKSGLDLAKKYVDKHGMMKSVKDLADLPSKATIRGLKGVSGFVSKNLLTFDDQVGLAKRQQDFAKNLWNSSPELAGDLWKSFSKYVSEGEIGIGLASLASDALIGKVASNAFSGIKSAIKYKKFIPKNGGIFKRLKGVLGTETGSAGRDISGLSKTREALLKTLEEKATKPKAAILAKKSGMFTPSPKLDFVKGETFLPQTDRLKDIIKKGADIPEKKGVFKKLGDILGTETGSAGRDISGLSKNRDDVLKVLKDRAARIKASRLSKKSGMFTPSPKLDFVKGEKLLPQTDKLKGLIKKGSDIPEKGGVFERLKGLLGTETGSVGRDVSGLPKTRESILKSLEEKASRIKAARLSKKSGMFTPTPKMDFVKGEKLLPQTDRLKDIIKKGSDIPEKKGVVDLLKGVFKSETGSAGRDISGLSKTREALLKTLEEKATKPKAAILAKKSGMFTPSPKLDFVKGETFLPQTDRLKDIIKKGADIENKGFAEGGMVSRGKYSEFEKELQKGKSRRSFADIIQQYNDRERRTIEKQITLTPESEKRKQNLLKKTTENIIKYSDEFDASRVGTERLAQKGFHKGLGLDQVPGYNLKQTEKSRENISTVMTKEGLQQVSKSKISSGGTKLDMELKQLKFIRDSIRSGTFAKNMKMSEVGKDLLTDWGKTASKSKESIEDYVSKDLNVAIKLRESLGKEGGPGFLGTKEERNRLSIYDVAKRQLKLPLLYNAVSQGKQLLDQPSKKVDLNKTQAEVYAFNSKGKYTEEELLKKGISAYDYARYMPKIAPGLYKPGAEKKKDPSEKIAKAFSGVLNTQQFEDLKKDLIKSMNEDDPRRPRGDKLGGWLKDLTPMHTGGLINDSGPYNLQKGEIVLPKRFKEGGDVGPQLQDMVEGNRASGSGTNLIITIENLGKLEELTKKLKIQNLDDLKDIKIEGIDDLPESIRVDAPESIPVDAPEFIRVDAPESIPVDAPEFIRVDAPESIPVDAPEFIRVDAPESIPVDAPEFIPVEVPEQVNVSIDITGLDTLERISTEGININGIEDLNDVTVTIQNQGAVGADNADVLARTLENLESKILSLDVTHKEDMQIVNEKLDSGGIMSIEELTNKHLRDDAAIYQELNEVSSDVISVESSILRLKQNLSVKFEEVDSKFNSALTHLYSIKR